MTNQTAPQTSTPVKQTSWVNRLWNWLTAPGSMVKEVGARQQAQLLAAVSFILGIATLGGALSTFVIGANDAGLRSNYVLAGLGVLSFISYFVSRTKYYTWGTTLITVGLTSTAYANINSSGDNLFQSLLTTAALAFIIASVLGPISGMGLLTVTNLVSLFITSNNIPTLSQRDLGTAAGGIVSIGGLFMVVMTARNAVERARLSEVRLVNQELQELSTSLEQRVNERTRDLSLAAEVGRRVSLVREPTALLTDAVNLVRERFDLYYTQVYLVDPLSSSLVLMAGTGQVGQQLLAHNHHLPVNTTSINGTAAVEHRAVIVADTTASSTFRPNPLLPDTRSEMAIPMMIGERVVGVLDLQSTRPGSLREENLPAFEVLAGQLATTVTNAELFEQAERARSEVETQSRRLVRGGWEDFLDALEQKERIGFTVIDQKTQPLTDPLPEVDTETTLVTPILVSGESIGKFHFAGEQAWTPEQVDLVNTVARQVGQQVENLRLLAQADRYQQRSEAAMRRLTREGWQEYLKEDEAARQGFAYTGEMVQPLQEVSETSDSHKIVGIQVGEEQIGEIDIADAGPLSGEDNRLVQMVSEQLGAHIENLRLFATAQQELEERRLAEEAMTKRAAELETVAKLSASVAAVNDPDQIMQSVVDMTKQSFGLYHAHLYELDEARKILFLAAGAGEVGRQMTAQGWEIPLSREQSLVASAARERRITIANDVRSEPDFLPNPLLPETRSEMAIPLLSGNRVLGVLDVQSNEVNHFTQEDANIQSTLASQIAAALENARLFEQIQSQAEQEALINSISQKIQSTTSVENALQVTIRELGRALGAQRTSVRLNVTNGGKPLPAASAAPRSNGKNQG